MLIIYWFVFISGASFSVFYPEDAAVAPAPNKARNSNPAPAATMGTTLLLLAVVVIVVVIGISINIFSIMTYFDKKKRNVD